MHYDRKVDDIASQLEAILNSVLAKTPAEHHIPIVEALRLTASRRLLVTYNDRTQKCRVEWI